MCSLIIVCSLVSCEGDDGNHGGDLIPSQLVINKENFTPEDIFVYFNKVYVSGLGDGTIQEFDLLDKEPTATEIVTTDPERPSRWGLAVDKKRKELLNIANVAYAFDGNVSAPAKVYSYSLYNNRETSSWTLPEGTVGNSIVVSNGFYYISDIGPNTRIIRLDPETGETVIKTDELLPSNGFGFGNLIVANGGLYGAVNNAMWFIALNDDGSFGEVSQVTGLENVFSDGMTYAGNSTFFYAENDALNPEDVGKVFRVSLDSTTSGSAVLEDDVENNGNLDNPSGLFFKEILNKDYLFVNESQLFNQDAAAPFVINIFEIK